MIRSFRRAAMPSLLAASLAALSPAARAQPSSPPAVAPAVSPAILPPPVAGKTVKAQPSPVVDSIAGGQKPAADAQPPAAKPVRRRVARRHRREAPLDVERPALAGVLLVEPLPPRFQGPRPIVPTPAYFVDSFVSAFTIPPPPIVCHRRPRDPDLPDPRFYREVPLACTPDIE